MMKFTDQFLDDLRGRVLVSEVVARKVSLKKKGKEYEGLSPFQAEKTPSFTVNDAKQLWKDFSSGKGGDVFAFLVEAEGLSFPDAVRVVAGIAGVALPGDAAETRPAQRAATGDDRSRGGPGTRGSDRDDGVAGPDRPAQPPASASRASPKKIDRVYDYTDDAGGLIYQVVRFVWEKDGAKKKSFAQRRVAPDGKYIWGLDVIDHHGEPIPFMSKPGRDWQQYDAEKFVDWHYSERATFEALGNVKHGFYRLPDVLEAIADGRPAVICEGEKDVDTLWEWGVPATTNSGGARHWGEQDLEIFRDADIIVAIDNDVPGRDRAGIIGKSLADIAKRVRVLDFAAVWKEAPKGADVTDWKEQCGGTVEQLYQIVATLPVWRPAPHDSRFGRLRWADQDDPHTGSYDWWIKGVIPKGETFLIVGPSQSGKSFEAFNLGMHVARGVDYRGCRTRQGLVIYAAMEGGKGFRDRLKAYRKHHDLPLEGIPFEVLTRRADLLNSDDDTIALIEEINAIAGEWPGVELAMVIIDTFSAATPGLKENASEDVSRVRQRMLRIQDQCRCAVGFVHHMNAEGSKARGHTSLTADVETQLEVVRVLKAEGKHLVETKDDDGRIIRRIRIKKQREGEDGQAWDFVLKAVETRRDMDGDAVTSCVTIDPARPADHREQQDRRNSSGDGFKLNKGEVLLFKALLTAMRQDGIATPAGADVPEHVRDVVDWEAVKLKYGSMVPNDEDDDSPEGQARHRDKVKKALVRARDSLRTYSVIGITQVGGKTGGHIVWPTGKKVHGPDLVWPPPVALLDRTAPQEQGSIMDFVDEIPT